ncbi:Ger(x)C family spore germination protein [Paenibacillus sp. FJAT-27812]|uniref:Ger(x)C family spore germination protein n=1 Tax=Paenibacillus sp. FJAT-27812 TaxID=1684143 RepID=UPI0006A7861D|nr:Ger(x)C family spore germination protein [Paenibacillus sp. FJAT-27812]
MRQVMRCAKLLLCISLITLTGCWDRKELNDRAILLGWGMDYKAGMYHATAQLATTSQFSAEQGGGAGKTSSFVTSVGKGKNIRSAADDMDLRLSRSLFAGHRRSILIGEDLAKHGIAKVIDEYSRYIIVRLRTDMFIVKGGTANDILKQQYPFERIPVLGIFKIHSHLVIGAETALRDFLIAASSEGSTPVLPVLQVLKNVEKENKKNKANESTIIFAGIAAFDEQLKLIGYLDAKTNAMRHWIMGSIKDLSLTPDVPEEHGNMSVDSRQLKSKVTVDLKGDNVTINIRLSGNGNILENNTKLDLAKSDNIMYLQKALNKDVEKEARNAVQKAQKIKADVFGFGEFVHRKYPKRWKTMQKNWQQTFARAKIEVVSDIIIRKTGQLGEPLQLKKKKS